MFRIVVRISEGWRVYALLTGSVSFGRPTSSLLYFRAEGKVVSISIEDHLTQHSRAIDKEKEGSGWEIADNIAVVTLEDQGS